MKALLHTETRTVLNTALQAACMEKQWCWCNAVMKINVPAAFTDGKGTFYLLPPRNLLQPFMSQKKQRAWVKTSVLLVPHLKLARFPMVPRKKERPAGTAMFSIHCFSVVVLKCPLFAFYLFTLKWELQVLVCRIAIAHNEKWQGSSISGVLSVHRLPAEQSSKVGTWVDIFS